MKTKKIKIFARIFSIFMIFCFAFLCVGCMGKEPNENDDDFGDLDGSGDDFFEELVVDMYGTKVLYRPDSYDFSKGAGGTEENLKDYYGEYAWWILHELIDLYGFADATKIPMYASSTIPTNEYMFFYDNIRYKVDAIGYVTKTKTVDASGQETTSDLASADQYILVGYNTNQSWKMTFDYDLSGLNNAYCAILDQHTVYSASSSKKYSKFASKEAFNQAISAKYTNDFKAFYYNTMLGSASATDYQNYSDYVKALQYAIYCYAVDVTPGTTDITMENNVTTSNQAFYTVSITEKDANNTTTTLSVDDALENAKARFQKLGTFVGLTEKQISNLANWIKVNVIGYESKVSNDNFNRYSVVTEVKTTDASGNTTTTYEFDMLNYSAGPFGRNYGNAVDLITTSMTSKVAIGSDGTNIRTIDNRFIASEVVEYAGDTFMIAGDANFPKHDDNASSTAIRPLEYQSILLMPKTQLKFSDIWIALKYDADLDGTTAGVWGTRYIDIIVELNYFNHSKQKSFKIGSQQTRVYDGPYELSPDGFDYDHGTLFFDGFGDFCKDSEFKSLLDDDMITIGKFNTEIGNGALKTDVGNSGYNGIPLVSNSPLTIVGTSSIKDFYSIVEPEENELTYSTQTFTTGKVNENKFKGSDGCDYLEITYKVIKNKADTNTNYKFYTGIAAIM